MKTLQELKRVRATNKQRSERKAKKKLDQQIEQKAKTLAKFVEENQTLLLTVHAPSDIHPTIAAEVVNRAMEILERRGSRIPAIILDSDWEGV